MRGALNGEWYVLEEYEEATRWLGRQQFSIKDDPERGSWDASDFEEIEPDEGS